MTWYQYQIAAGYNNAAGLVNIETITASGDYRPFHVPDGFAYFDQGIEKIRFDRLSTLVGFPSTSWAFVALSRLQYSYLRSTYATGGYRGKVTIKTIGADGISFGNYNAILVIPKLTEFQRKSRNYPDVKLKFVGLVVL